MSEAEVGRINDYILNRMLGFENQEKHNESNAGVPFGFMKIPKDFYDSV
jgi:hypothetical protein